VLAFLLLPHEFFDTTAFVSALGNAVQPALPGEPTPPI
jgi:hypothetical protein